MSQTKMNLFWHQPPQDYWKFREVERCRRAFQDPRAVFKTAMCTWGNQSTMTRYGFSMIFLSHLCYLLVDHRVWLRFTRKVCTFTRCWLCRDWWNSGAWYPHHDVRIARALGKLIWHDLETDLKWLPKVVNQSIYKPNDNGFQKLYQANLDTVYLILQCFSRWNYTRPKPIWTLSELCR